MESTRGNGETLIKVRVLNEKGHQELEMAPQELAEMAQETGSWIFVNGRYVDAADAGALSAGEAILSPRVLAG